MVPPCDLVATDDLETSFNDAVGSDYVTAGCGVVVSRQGASHEAQQVKRWKRSTGQLTRDADRLSS